MFSHLIGNADAKDLLLKIIPGKQATGPFLFHGPDGIGKGLFALECAKILMGKAHIPRIESGNHPDLHIFHTQGKSALHSAETVRAWIHEMTLPPFEAPYKVFIIHDAHAMLPASSNALLKTLEEPPEDTYIFLITSRIHEILPTILSRCYEVPFFSITTIEMQEYLQKKHLSKVTSQQYLSCGSFKTVEELARPETQEKTQLLYQLLELKLPSDYSRAFFLAEKLSDLCTPEEGEEHGGFALLNQIFSWYRDLALLQTCTEPLPLDHEDKRETLTQIALTLI